MEMSENTEETDVSLLSGGLRRLGRHDNSDDNTDKKDLVLRDDVLTVANTGPAGNLMSKFKF